MYNGKRQLSSLLRQNNRRIQVSVAWFVIDLSQIVSRCELSRGLPDHASFFVGTHLTSRQSRRDNDEGKLNPLLLLVTATPIHP